jgi:hypothetical protein
MALLSSPLLACECAYPSQADSFRLAYAIFRGKAVAVQHLPSAEQTTHSSGSAMWPKEIRQEVTLLVDAVWKGQVARRVAVRVTSHPRMCDGYEFVVGAEYVVYVAPKIDTEWDERLKRLRSSLGLTIDPPATSTSFEIGDCPLRIRPDVVSESKALGSARPPK